MIAAAVRTRPPRAAAIAIALFVCVWAPAPLSGVREPVRARNAMVIAQQPADEAGLVILRRGGNAVDAAVAIGFALHATYPESSRVWLKGGAFYEPGDRMVLPELAATLSRIAANGPDEFYAGETAVRLAAAMQANRAARCRPASPPPPSAPRRRTTASSMPRAMPWR